MQMLPPPDPPQVIIVTGKPLPEPESARAYAVDKINRERLRDTPSHQLDQVLRSVPGLQLFRRSDSTSGHPTSQGVTLRSLGGNASSRALLVLDGVPQADPFGGWVNWPAYNPASLAEVTVIRGAGGVTHGPGALAGVIEMTSLSEDRAAASLEVGSRESVAGHLHGGAQLGGSLLSIDAQGARSSGFVPVTEDSRGPVDRASPYREGSVRTRWVAPVTDAIEVQAAGLGFVDVRDRGVPFTGNRSRGADASLRLVGRGDWRWAATAYANWRNFRSSFASVDDDRTTAQRVALQYSVPSRGLGASFEVRPPIGADAELRVGGDMRFTNGHSNELYSYQQGSPTRQRVSGGNSATQGVFADVSWKTGPVTLTGGARLDHWSISNGALEENEIATGNALRDDHFARRSGWRPTARAGAVVDIVSGLSLRSAAYLGWRMPTLNELFRPFRAGPDATAANPSLDPERLSGVEAGIRYSGDGLEVELTAFANRLSGAIANVTLDHGPGLFPGVGFVAGDYRQRQNLDAVNVGGLEASGAIRQGPWRARVGASYSRARVDASGPAAALNGLRPAQTPLLVLVGEVQWRKGRRSASISVRHSGSQFEDDLNEVRLPPATTVGAFASWPLTNRLELITRIENLLDETVVATADSDGTIERATPRTLWVGVRLADF